MQLTVRQPSASEDAKHYTTERLRGEYLIETVFAPDDAILTYSHFDRIIAGGVMPVSKSVELVGCKELASDTFLQRREMGVINIGGEGTVTVTYHPKGHPGSFDRRIFVYTQLSDKMPTAILHLTGTVIASERTDGDYPYAMGALRLKQQSVRLAPERLQNERIECLNTGGKAMRPRCDEHLLPPGITFRCEPATLAPGAKGDLVIGFDPAQATRRPPVQLPLILEGPDVPPSGRTLQIRFEETE